MRRKPLGGLEPCFISPLASLTRNSPFIARPQATTVFFSHCTFSGRSLTQSSRACLPHHAIDTLPRQRSGVLMFNEGGGQDAEGLEDEEEEDSVVLTDDATGHTLSCGVEHEIEHDGTTYLLCYPLDEVVMFARTGRKDENEDELVALDDQAQIDMLFPVAEKVLSEDDIVLKNTAFFLTIDDMSEAIEEDEVQEEDNEGADEEVEVMTHFENQGQSFLVVKPMFPVLLIAKEVDGELAVLYGDELDRISDVVDEQIYRELAEESTANNQTNQ